MEENPEGHMETDVSSTTQDIPAVQDVSASINTMEVTVEVAETTVEVEEHVEDEQDQRIDSNTPETIPQTKEKEMEVITEDVSIKVPTQDSLTKESLPLTPKTPPKEKVQEPSTKTLIKSVTPLKLSNKTEKLLNSSSSCNDVTPVKSPNLKSLNKDTIVKTPTKLTGPELTSHVTNNISSVEEIQKTPRKTEEVDTDENMVTPKEKPPVKDQTKVATSCSTSKVENIEITEKDEVVVLVPSEIQIEIASTDSQETVTSASEVSEKEHNKSISRELKSLIDSAKESKIISECTQLQSKTRKSRLPLDTSCGSLNSSVDADKIQGNRRESTASQKSNCSEKSEKVSLKRSMRSQNPEFVNKQKQFLNTVTAKLHKGDDSSHDANDDEATEDSKKKEISNDISTSTPKKKKVDEEKPPEQMPAHKSSALRSDPYCWSCHWLVRENTDDNSKLAQCTICPRSFHPRCLTVAERAKVSTEENWACPKCITILHAENSETRSPVMRKISLGMLCDLLKHALKRMMELNGVEPFMGPVDRSVFPDYDKYVVHPVDLNLMKENISAGVYGSTEAFLSDAQWILHNSVIFNTLTSKLTGAARALVRSCRTEMGEIEACPECYAAAHARRHTWFTDVCSTPHILLWAKLKGFPYWPAKGMSVNNSGMVDVRFFGAHDRAWVPARDCFLYSEKDPNNFRTKRQDILDSMQEAEQHIRNLSRKFGKFVYPAYKVVFEPSKLTEQLKLMIPGFEPDPASPKIKQKSFINTPSPASKKSKNSKYSSADCEKSDGEELSEPKRKMADGTEIQQDNNKQTTVSNKTKEDIDVTEKGKSEKMKEKESRKRRRSQMEEASILTIMSPASEKRARLVSAEMTIINNDAEQNKPDNNKKTENNIVTEKPALASPKPQQKEQKEGNITVTRVTRTSTPSSATKQPNKQTPKVSTPKETDKVKKSKVAQRDSTPNEKNTPQENKVKRRDRTSKGSKSASSTPKTSVKKNDTPLTSKEKSKEDNQDKEVQSENATPKSKTKSLKDRIVFDDDNTSLAVLAKKTNDICFPTITNVRSLSQTDFTQNSSNTEEANTSIFTPTSTEQVANMKDAVAKLQRLRNDTDQSMVGRVGVRAFARMTSPPAAPEKQNNTSDKVEIEVKAEPMDYDDNQTEKINLLNTIRLRPVNQPLTSLRDVRITKVGSTTSMVIRKPPAPAKQAEVRPKARKTFPQPQKSGEGRSDLNSKNSMVYIPIQPPVTQAPVRPAVRVQASPAGGAAAVATPPLRPIGGTSASVSSCNNIVNTVTTPIMTVVTLPSGVPNPSPALTTITQMPNIGPLGNMGPLANIGHMGNLGPLGQIGTVGQVGGVHTVPLITSVNGQWTFSLQPMMSVGGVDRVQTPPPLVNGVTDALVPLSTSTSTITTPPSSISNNAPPQPSRVSDSTPGELPRLQGKPGVTYQLDSNIPAEVPTPSAAGPITALLNQNATKLTDIFRNLLEESIEKLEPAAAQQQLTLLKLHMEKIQWKHKQEIEEIRHNNLLVINEMRTSFEKEKSKLLQEVRRSCGNELFKAVKHAKSKQWCANCQKEAQYYCCWNTSYCDYPCQRMHWAQHYEFCTQHRTAQNNVSDSVDLTEERLQPPENPPALQKGSALFTAGGKQLPPRNHSQNNASTNNSGKSSIIVSMVEDTGGNQTVKCVGTYKAKTNQSSPSSLLLNNQIMNDENAAKKVVTSGGYLIVGAGAANNPSLVIN